MVHRQNFRGAKLVIKFVSRSLGFQVISSRNRFSKWSTWSPCSRSCDGGITTRQRTCRETQCEGLTHEDKICNIQPCPANLLSLGSDFRDQQCSLYNDVPYEVRKGPCNPLHFLGNKGVRSSVKHLQQRFARISQSINPKAFQMFVQFRWSEFALTKQLCIGTNKFIIICDL